MVVVLPAPLIPTTRITNGLSKLGSKPLSVINSDSSSILISSYKLSSSLSSFLDAFFLTLSITLSVVCMPISELIKRTSSSSRRSSSIFFLPITSEDSPSPSFFLDLKSRSFKEDLFFSFSGSES